MIMLGFSSITQFFWPVNYLERVINSKLIMKAETHKK